MLTTKTENDSMNMTIVITVRCGRPHGWIHREVLGNQDTQALFFFVQYKTVMAPSIWDTRWQPMLHPSLSIHLHLAEIFSYQIIQSIIYTTRRREEWRGRMKGWFGFSVCSSLIFYETGEVTLIWSGTSSPISWASWSATSWIVWVCEVRVT